MSAWGRLCELAAYGPKPGERAAADEFLTSVEALTAAAREKLRPRATTPAKAQMIRWAKPQLGEANATLPAPVT